MEMSRVPFYSLEYAHDVYTQPRADTLSTSVNATSSTNAPNVHVNPNFRNGKSLVIHVNPKMHQNRKIHVNPKMMKGIAPVVKEKKVTNETMVTNRILHNGRVGNEIQKLIHVNPKMMSRLCSKVDVPAKAETAKSNVFPIDSDEVARNAGSKSARLGVFEDKASSKATMPCLLSISRRKLVRIGPGTRRTIVTSPLKKLNKKTLPLIHVNTKSVLNSPNSTRYGQTKIRHKMNAYKIDRTTQERVKSKKIRAPIANVRSVNKGLITIGGVKYRSSRTRLVRSDARTHPHKRRSANGEVDAFVMAKNGKKLQRLNTVKTLSVPTYVISRNSFNARTVIKEVPNSVVQTSQKNIISYKVKQRSLQILRDKLRKNYIPCLLYRRFGYCAKYAKGMCPKLHDKKQIALCRNFLQGKCLLDDCPLSHDIGPEKMPTCKYFLEGCCIRDGCPYLHVKVSSKTPICSQFLRGYCSDGNKCKKRHTNICPEYEKSGKCARGKYCPYPHKLKTLKTLVTKTKVPKNVRSASSNKRTSNTGTSKIVRKVEQDSRKRYYDKASMSDEQLAEMRESIIKKMKCLKEREKNREERDRLTADEVNDDEKADKSDREWTERPRRAPLDPLPAYIPIN